MPIKKLENCKVKGCKHLRLDDDNMFCPNHRIYWLNVLKASGVENFQLSDDNLEDMIEIFCRNPENCHM